MSEKTKYLFAFSLACCLFACELNRRRLDRVEAFLIARAAARRRPWWVRLYAFLTSWRRG